MKLDFGTAGIRGIVGNDENQLNEIHAARIFDGYARFLLANFNDAQKRGVVIGRDNRIKGKSFTLIAYKILVSYGIKVFFNNKMLPTPFISFLTRTKNAIGAINVTASHNPKEYNGIKIYDENGCQLLPDKVENLKGFFNKYENYKSYLNFDYQKEIVEFEKNPLIDSIKEKDYDEYIKEILKLNLNNQDISNIKIVYSSLHGTGYEFISLLFSKTKSNIFYEKNEIVEDENFSFVKNPNPESELAFENTIKLSEQINGDLILITDPDSDRVGLAIKNRENKYILLNGNEIAILIVDYIIKYKKIKNPDNWYLIYSFVSSTLPAKICHENNINSHVTDTGFKWIGKKIEELSKFNKKMLFSFEESFGSLINDKLSHDKDAIQALFMLAIIASNAKENGMTILEQLDSIYKKYGYVSSKSFSFDIKDNQNLLKIQEKFKKLSFENSEFVDYNKGIKDILPTNMYSFVFDDQYSWVSIRPSGTEPKIKLYIHVIKKTKEESLKMFQNIYQKTKTIFE